MKTFSFTLPLVVLFCITILHSCTIFDKGGDCEGSEMDLVEPLIYLRATFHTDAFFVETSKSIFTAERMIISGSIQKEYCSGELSGYFTFSPTFYPTSMTNDSMLNGFYLPQPYQYKFNNKEDELIVLARIKVYMPDNIIFESDEFIFRYHYSDIKYETSSLKYYIMISFGATPGWHRVTS